MNASIPKSLIIIFCLLVCISFLNACAVTSEREEKSAVASKLERYEDKVIRYSIAYDAKELTKDLMLTGSFVFRKQSPMGMPSIGVSADPYPTGTALEDTAVMIVKSLPRTIPGCVVHNMNNQQQIKLMDGTAANYFEIDGMLNGQEAIAAFVAAENEKRLFVFGAADRKQGSMKNLAAMVKSLRFDVEVDEAALKAKGFGKDGKFMRTDSPAFTLDYPKAFQNRALRSNQIFRAGIPRDTPAISIAILLLRPDEDIHPQLAVWAQRYAKGLEFAGDDIQIISQNPIQNYKAFDAYQIQITWRYRGRTTLSSVVHLIAKEDKVIQLAGHTMYNTDELIDIFKTINLNPG